jgi:hypothetical protein
MLMQLLDSLGSFINIATILKNGSRNWSQIKRANGVYAIDNFKRTTTSGLASGPIVGKFSLSKGEIPLTDVLFHKTPQEVFQTSINNFSLTICMGMACRAKLENNSKLSPKCTPKITNKLGITIGSVRFGNAMKLDYLPEIQFSNKRCIKSFVARDKMV